MAEKKASSRKEPSDLFEVEEATPSIAPVDKIVLPPEEALKRRIRRFIAAGVAAVIFFLIAHAILGWIRDARLQSAVDDVIDDASPETIETALGLLRYDPDPSVRARLLATAGLGGDAERLQEAEALLAESPSQNDPDQRIARIYAFLAEGDARAAHGEAERPAKYADQADAFLLGRARTALARGQWEQAFEDATEVAEARAGAPEPAALLARVTARTKGPEQALAVLDRLDRETAATQIARARIVGLVQRNDDEAIALANDVLADDGAAIVHRAWAHLIKAEVAYRQGAIGAAYQHARKAAEPELRVDELLLIDIARLMLALDRNSDAKLILRRLSSGPSADIFERAHVLAWWYAQSGDMQAGLATLSGAGFGPELEAAPPFRALVLAELLRLSPRGDDRARSTALYRETADDPQWGVVASNALGEVLLEEGNTEEALTVLRDGLAAHPHHLTLVDTAAVAYIAADRVDEAEAMTSAALDALRNEGWAHGSHARVLLAQGKASEALGALDRAVELSPNDAQLFALRGDAARKVSSNDEAAASYEKALQLDPNEPRALSGFVALLIDLDDFERAGEVIDKMNEAKIGDLRADQQRLRYLVRTGAGQSGTTTMRNAVSRHGKNVPLRLAGARVYLQAEEYGRAASYFRLAKRHGANPRLADTGVALAQAYGRRILGAENTLERAVETVDDDGNPLQVGPEVQVWELVVKARVALADDKRGLAARYARRAASVRPDDPDLQLLRADIEEDRERSPEEPLRNAASADVPMPVAWGRLAILLGPTEEGCELASRYLRANRRGREARRVREVVRKCED